MLKKAFKYLSLFLLVYLMTCILTPYCSYLKYRSIENQISYLSGIMKQDYDDTLQSRFPEGKLFSNAILALSIIDYCDYHQKEDKEKATIVDRCVKRILSKRALSTFNPDMQPKFGMFYNGWTSFVLRKYQNSNLYKYSGLTEEVEAHSQLIENRIASALSDSLRIMDTYPEANWPADNLLGLIALQNDSLKQQWLAEIIRVSQHPSGLIHHAGSEPSVVRGSSSALMTYCLSAMHYKDSMAYDKLYRKTFIDNYLGIQMVKEHENGSNDMDVDSGPILFGYGASATIMNIKTQARLNNPKSKHTWAFMNCLALPINLFGKKYYLFQQEPMLDIFMLWGCVEM